MLIPSISVDTQLLTNISRKGLLKMVRAQEKFGWKWDGRTYCHNEVYSAVLVSITALTYPNSPRVMLFCANPPGITPA